jgi:hypothetical protein
VEPMISRTPFMPGAGFVESTFRNEPAQPLWDDLLEEMIHSIDEFLRPPFSRW